MELQSCSSWMRNKLIAVRPATFERGGGCRLEFGDHTARFAGCACGGKHDCRRGVQLAGGRGRSHLVGPARARQLGAGLHVYEMKTDGEATGGAATTRRGGAVG